MKIKPLALPFCITLGALFLAACASEASSAAPAILEYLKARVANDLTGMINWSCPEWEPQAQIEVSTFQALQADLEDVTCEDAGEDGDAALVACTGKIVTTYNGEQREWDLSARQFRAVLDDGQWRMCGYK